MPVGLDCWEEIYYVDIMWRQSQIKLCLVWLAQSYLRRSLRHSYPTNGA